MSFISKNFKIQLLIWGEKVAEICMISHQVKFLKEVSDKQGIIFLLRKKCREIN